MDEEASDNQETRMDPAARDVALVLAEQIALPGGAPHPGIFLGGAGDAILIYDTEDNTRRYYVSIKPGGSKLEFTLVSGGEVQGPLSLPVRPDVMQEIAVRLNPS
ncbi:MAG: hypothetical protein AB1758_20755 [Candidatus Eremiobacterota bacterium]